jgi:hypothetical protein
VGDQALYNLVNDNVLENWPRGNNGYYSWGGWPLHFGAYGCYQCVFRGNIVYHGGGEGILNYGSMTGVTTGGNLVEQNVVYDNWSVEIYFDNQPGNTARNNFIFSHPKAAVQGDLLGYWDKGARLLNASGVALADEAGSGPGTALANSTVTGNIIVNSFNAISDTYDGGTTGTTHALINTKISNNTILLPPNSYADSNQYGLNLLDNGGRNTGTTVSSNEVLGFGLAGDVHFSYNICPTTGGCAAAPFRGVTANSNVYFLQTGTKAFIEGSGSLIDFPTWKGASGQDAASQYVDPGLLAPAKFNDTPALTPVFDPRNALPPAGSASSPGANWVF